MPGEGEEVIGLTGQPALQVVGGEKPETHTVLSYVSASGLVCPPPNH